MYKADAVRNAASEDLRKGVAYVEPGDTPPLLLFLVPHGDDKNKNRCNAGLKSAPGKWVILMETQTSFRRHQAVFEQLLDLRNLCKHHETQESSPIS